jgi:hypothetical protein
MLKRMQVALGAALALCLSGTSGVAGQIRGSEQAVVGQTVDGTTIMLEYSRPVAKGRELFGKLVPWNVVWTPGANWATTLEVNRDVRLNGVEVPTGKYSVWMIPRQGKWTVTLNRNPKIFHFQKPDSSADQIHIAATPEQGGHTEMLTWSFPVVNGDAAVLRMQWGDVAVPLQVVVQPSRPVQLSAEDRATYTGAYEMRMIEGVGWPTTGRLEVFEKNGLLRGRLPFPIHPGDELEFDLVPAGTNRFSPGIYRDGRLFNVEMGGTFEFDVTGTRATTVRLRGIEGTVFGEGTRAGG